ncbi:hypothetical protein FA95DRAFT_664634 [Auriscalpium vulgare]|uniref:Uncharacterized protein n=1 Tax=Auriscalpium vulgare TaxID=40419 RepID=A0ACB8S1S4_9AGAM|nr:hypothetical protein FA95DRAFT_664634 [Auriscalpium vulgare]
MCTGRNCHNWLCTSSAWSCSTTGVPGHTSPRSSSIARHVFGIHTLQDRSALRTRQKGERWVPEGARIAEVAPHLPVARHARHDEARAGARVALEVEEPARARGAEAPRAARAAHLLEAPLRIVSGAGQRRARRRTAPAHRCRAGQSRRSIGCRGARARARCRSRRSARCRAARAVARRPSWC